MTGRSDWAVCIKAAERVVAASRPRRGPAWINEAADNLLRLCPASGIGREELSLILCAIVIERGWSLTS